MHQLNSVSLHQKSKNTAFVEFLFFLVWKKFHYECIFQIRSWITVFKAKSDREFNFPHSGAFVLCTLIYAKNLEKPYSLVDQSGIVCIRCKYWFAGEIDSCIHHSSYLDLITVDKLIQHYNPNLTVVNTHRKRGDTLFVSWCSQWCVRLSYSFSSPTPRTRKTALIDSCHS